MGVLEMEPPTSSPTTESSSTSAATSTDWFLPSSALHSSASTFLPPDPVEAILFRLEPTGALRHRLRIRARSTAPLRANASAGSGGEEIGPGRALLDAATLNGWPSQPAPPSV